MRQSRATAPITRLTFRCHVVRHCSGCHRRGTGHSVRRAAPSGCQVRQCVWNTRPDCGAHGKHVPVSCLGYYDTNGSHHRRIMRRRSLRPVARHPRAHHRPCKTHTSKELCRRFVGTMSQHIDVTDHRVNSQHRSRHALIAYRAFHHHPHTYIPSARCTCAQIYTVLPVPAL